MNARILEEWENLRNEGRNEIEIILERVDDDNRAVTAQAAYEGLRYLSELDENWSDYETPEWFHGTRSVNIPDILENGLIPGSDNASSTGEVINHDKVCLGRFGLALNYAREGTPEPEKIQTHVDQAYEIGIVNNDSNNAPDISTEEGREKFSSDAKDVKWRVGNPLPGAVENFEAIAEANESDPIVIGVKREMMEPEPKHIDEYEDMTELELYNQTKRTTEISTDYVIPGNMHIFVPHVKLESYREDYGDQANILSIEAMRMKLDHDNRENHQQNGTVNYRGVWNPDTEFFLTLESDSEPYNQSALIPDSPK